MTLPTAKDTQTGVPISRVTSGEGIHLLPYYTARCLSHDNRFLCCTRSVNGIAQAWLFDLESGSGRPVSELEAGVIDESVAFHPTQHLLFYGAEDAVYRYDLATEETVTVFKCNPGFRLKSEISAGATHLVFWIYELIDPGVPGPGAVPEIGSFHPFRNCRSYVLAADVATGNVHAVWGDTSPLTHPVVDPLDGNVVLYANQGIHERLQELFTIPLHGRDNIHPTRLYEATRQRPIYVGHSFFTYDGWVGTQLIEFGGERPDGSVPDMVDYNAIIRPDGTCDRRARCPGGNKPMHSHSAYADSWWVGDGLPREGEPSDPHMLCVMKNNWDTGYSQAEPLAAHGCSHQRPCHVHPRFSPDEKMVLFSSNHSGDCHVYIAHTEEFLANWTDRVPFGKRQYRHGTPPALKSRDGVTGPPV